MSRHDEFATVLSQLPDISLPKFDLIDSSFFRDGPGCRKLPTLYEVPEASGARLSTNGIWYLRELGVAVKYGHGEALVPEVFGRGTAGETGPETNFIYISIMPRGKLARVRETLSREEKEAVSRQLKGIVKRLRSVEQDPADRFMGSLNRGPAQYLYFGPGHYKGPFSTARGFHDWAQFISTDWLPMAERPPDPYRSMLPDTARMIVLTHADLQLNNILVVVLPDNEIQATVSGIVDWEQAGLYPEYWEYCKAYLVGGLFISRTGRGWMDQHHVFTLRAEV